MAAESVSSFSLSGLASVFRAKWAAISRQMGNPGRSFKAAAGFAHAVYMNTLKSSLPFIVIGPNQIRRDPLLQKNLCLVTASIKKKQASADSGTGAILGERQWSTLINDFFIMAAINSDKEVHTTLHALPPTDQLWDTKKRTFTSFGREIAILKLAGYQERILWGQLIFRPGWDERAPLDYGTLSEQLAKFDSDSSATKFFGRMRNVIVL